MRQKKRYQDDLRSELQHLCLYSEKNERLIQTAATAMWFIDSMEDELRRQSLTIRTTGSQGQTKIMQHPHIESIRKYNQQLAYIYARLGLGNDEIIEIEENNKLATFLDDILT